MNLRLLVLMTVYIKTIAFCYVRNVRLYFISMLFNDNTNTERHADGQKDSQT